jgi:putative DNA primase/helicase
MSDFNNVDRDKLEPPLHLINMKNGIFNVRTCSLTPHSPDYYFINQIPINYNPKAKCKKFLKFIGEVVYPEHIPVVQEMLGFLFYRKYFLHVAFLLVGGGRNGKGVLVNVIEALLGKENLSTEPLEDLTARPFSSSELYGKMANIGSEISGKELVNANKFKILTGNEPTKGEVKFGCTFTFRNYAKLIFNTNKIPYSRDHSFAFKQRWIIIPFPNTFPRGEPGTDPRLEEKLTTHGELEGIFNWAMEGLKRILEKYDFSYKAGNQYDEMINPEKRFIMDNIEVVYENVLTKDDIYDKYKKFCEDNLYQILTRAIFMDKIKYFMPESVEGRYRIGNNRVYGFKNIGWKD